MNHFAMMAAMDHRDQPGDNETLRQLITRAGLTVELTDMPPTGSTDGQTAPDPFGSDKLGRYPVTGRLGAGGMGEVLQVKDEDVGRELGVHYVVEGSIRKAGNRVRVTVQLLEAATANHVWAERYDRELTDIF